MNAPPSLAPGVYLDVATRKPPPAFDTGVPALLGFYTGALGPDEGLWSALRAGAGSRVIPVDGSLWSRLGPSLCASPATSFLGFAARGFFENGGLRCYLVAPDPGGLPGIEPGLDELDAVADFDLICAPDMVRLADPMALGLAQRRLLVFTAARRGCFAILDSLASPGVLPDVELGRVNAHRDQIFGAPGAENGAMYMPWIKVEGAGFVPPSGHVAGIFALTDQRIGVHKAPANEPLQGALDLQLRIGPATQEALNPRGINCIRAFPGRGIRIWGARTLGSDASSAYVNVRRLVLTVGRWLEQATASAAFEPNDANLWARIRREVNTYLGGLFEKGAFQGSTRDEAFFVKCDAETNPSAVRDEGRVVIEIGLSPRVPGEFVNLRVILGREGASAASP